MTDVKIHETCKTCKHWRHEVLGADTWRICEVIGGEAGMYVATIGRTKNRDLQTHGDFSCRFHEPRPKLYQLKKPMEPDAETRTSARFSFDEDKGAFWVSKKYLTEVTGDE